MASAIMAGKGSLPSAGNASPSPETHVGSSPLSSGEKPASAYLYGVTQSREPTTYTEEAIKAVAKKAKAEAAAHPPTFPDPSSSSSSSSGKEEEGEEEAGVAIEETPAALAAAVGKGGTKSTPGKKGSAPSSAATAAAVLAGLIPPAAKARLKFPKIGKKGDIQSEEFAEGGKYYGMEAALKPGQQPFVGSGLPGVDMETLAEPPSDPHALSHRQQAAAKREVLKSMAKKQVGATQVAPGTTSTAGESANAHTAMLQTISSGASTAAKGEGGFAYGGPYNYPTEVGNPAFLRLIHGYRKTKDTGVHAGSSLWRTTHTKAGKLTERKKYYKYSQRKNKWRKVSRDYKAKWVKNRKKHEEAPGASSWPSIMRHKSLEHLIGMYGGGGSRK